MTLTLERHFAPVINEPIPGKRQWSRSWARVLADSVSGDGIRLTTLETRIPRIVLAEKNTHRALSRNSASTRAIPTAKQIAMLRKDPFVPDRFPKNMPGMSAQEYFEPGTKEYDIEVVAWLDDMDRAIESALARMKRGVHKQIASRPLETWMWQTIIVSATDWENFFDLRCHPQAQPQIQDAALAMRAAMEASSPNLLSDDEWHLPLIGFDGDEELSPIQKIKVSTGRCARVSYLTHDGIRDVDADLDLFGKLHHPVGPQGEPSPPHLSPFEHPAHPARGHHGNFNGWKQARQYVEAGVNFELLVAA